MFKKIEVWIVGLIVIFFILLIILVSGVLRDAYLAKNRTPEFLRKNLTIVAEFPVNIYHVANFFLNKNAPPKLQKHKDKKRLQKYIPFKRNALLVLPRYDHSISRSVVDIIDLNNFKVIHSYRHDIGAMNDKIPITKKFSDLHFDNSPTRFLYFHPLIFENGSLISMYLNGPIYKIDLCSNLQLINYERKFHHSLEIDHEGNIFAGGYMDTQSKYIKKHSVIEDEDSIIKINTDGKILYEKSVFELLIENKLLDVNIFTQGWDPFHLNYIEPALSDTKYWKKGDIFLSLRNQSKIIQYRPRTNQVISNLTGPFAQQHDIQIISDKEIAIFNNNNFIVDNEYSQIIIYNFETNTFRTLFNDQLQEENFKTHQQGLSHIFKDGALLVEEQTHGRIILFNSKGEKEWVFVNKDKNGDIGHVSWSRVIEDEIFIEKFKSMVENKKCLN